MNTMKEIRCPVGPKRLLTKLLLSGDQPQYTNDNLIEFACADCRRTLKNRGEFVTLVLHRYNFLGEHIEDAVIR